MRAEVVYLHTTMNVRFPVKKFLSVISLVIVCAPLCAQEHGGDSRGQTLPYIYYIPPTDSCNGVVAISISGLEACAGSTANPMSAQPFGCADILGGVWFNGDTMFFPVCFEPCSIAWISNWGDICVYIMPGNVAVHERGSPEGIVFKRTEDGVLMLAREPLVAPSCRIHSLTGSILLEKSLPSGARWMIAIDHGPAIITLHTSEARYVGKVF